MSVNTRHGDFGVEDRVILRTKSDTLIIVCQALSERRVTAVTTDVGYLPSQNLLLLFQRTGVFHD